MKQPLALLALLLPVALCAAQSGSEGLGGLPSFGGGDTGSLPATTGTPGVEDGTCWKNSSGNEIDVEVRGTLHGDQKVTVNEGDESGTGTGTPDPDGGCHESSPISVDGETYRVDAGGMEWKNPAGDWINMTEVKCDDDDDDDAKVSAF